MVSPILINMIVSSVLSAGIASAVSPLAALSRSTMAALQMLHVVIAGGFLGVLIYHMGMPIPPIATTIVFSLLMSIAIAELIERGFTQDVAAAISAFTSCAIAALSGFLASRISSTALTEAWSFLIGSLVLIRITDILTLALLLIITTVLVLMFHREVIYISFDEEGARAMGLRVRYYRYLLYGLLSVVAVGLSMSLGAIIAHILLAAPGAISSKISTSIRQVFGYSLGISMLSVCIGIVLAYRLALPPGAMIGVAVVLIYLVFTICLRGFRR